MCLPVDVPAEDTDVRYLSLLLKLKYNYIIFPFSFLPPPLPMYNLALKFMASGLFFLNCFEPGSLTGLESRHAGQSGQ